MKVVFKTGNVVDEPADGLVCTGNVQLNMSGGVNGELLVRGGRNMQEQLHAYLTETGRKHVEPGFVMEIGPEPTAFRCVVYAVTVDGFYGSSVELVAKALTAALGRLAERGCRTVATPALATGYGPLKIADFVTALRRCVDEADWPFAEVRVVLRSPGNREEALAAWKGTGGLHA